MVRCFWDNSRARTGGWNGSRAGGEPGGRNGSCAGPGGPDDRRSVAVQLQLPPDGGRRRARPRDAAAALHRRPDGRRRHRLRDAAAASDASGRNDRRSAALRRRVNAASRRGSRRRRPDGPQVRMEQLLGPAPHRVGTGRHANRTGGENDFTRRLSTSP